MNETRSQAKMIRLSDDRLSEVIGWAESYTGSPGSLRDDNALAVKELRQIRKGIRDLQERCCGSDDLCNGCRALLGLLAGVQP